MLLKYIVHGETSVDAEKIILYDVTIAGCLCFT